MILDGIVTPGGLGDIGRDRLGRRLHRCVVGCRPKRECGLGGGREACRQRCGAVGTELAAHFPRSFNRCQPSASTLQFDRKSGSSAGQADDGEERTIKSAPPAGTASGSGRVPGSERGTGRRDPENRSRRWRIRSTDNAGAVHPACANVCHANFASPKWQIFILTRNKGLCIRRDSEAGTERATEHPEWNPEPCRDPGDPPASATIPRV